MAQTVACLTQTTIFRSETKFIILTLHIKQALSLGTVTLYIFPLKLVYLHACKSLYSENSWGNRLLV